MYLPDTFREPDQERLHAFIDRYPFGTLVVAEGGGAEVAHLPFLLDRPSGELLFHVARANPMRPRQALAIFHGPHAYVSPTWYEQPEQHVPTWNYAVVHAHGSVRQLSDGELLASVERLVSVYETTWRLDPTLRPRLLPQIIGFALAIERLEGKFKLSQNRSETDRKRVARKLGGEIAALMRGAATRPRRRGGAKNGGAADR